MIISKDITPYRGSEPYIFLSYAQKNKDEAIKIIEHLQSHGFRLWYNEGIDPRTEWDRNIAARLKNCGYFIALLSPEYLASSNCKNELNYARDLEKPGLLIYLSEVKLPEGMRLSQPQAIHKYTYRDNEQFFRKLYDAKGISVCLDKNKFRQAELGSSTDSSHASSLSHPLTNKTRKSKSSTPRINAEKPLTQTPFLNQSPLATKPDSPYYDATHKYSGVNKFNQSPFAGRLSLGSFSSAVVKNDGSVWTFGWNLYDNLGTGANHEILESSIIPIRVPIPERVSSVIMRATQVAALNSKNEVFIWGSNARDLRSSLDKSLPEKYAHSSIRQIELGEYHCLNLDTYGHVSVDGNNTYGQWGDGTTGSTYGYKTLPFPDRIVQIASGPYHCLVLTENGEVFSWGKNNAGELGNGKPRENYPLDSNGKLKAYEAIPLKVSLPDKVMQIAAGSEETFACSAAVTENGELFMWGDNTYYQLGSGKRWFGLAGGKGFNSTPKKVQIPGKVSQVALGRMHSAALTEDNRLFVWGSNDFGQLGIGKFGSKVAEPLELSFPERVSYISLGGFHSAAITEEGSLFTWGRNDFGQLGDGTTQSKSTPVRIMTGLNPF